MWTMRAVIMGVALALLGGAGEAFAQVLLDVQQRRVEDAAEERINDLRARASCHDQQAATRRQIYAAYLDQLQATSLRDVCRTVARTEGQRARCD